MRTGAVDDAVRLAQEAVAALNQTQELFTLSSLLLDAAEVLELAGRTDDATAALRDAIRVSEQKGAITFVRRANERLGRLAVSG